MRILIVEDEIALATGLQKGLSRQGYSCDAVFDGLAAIKSIALNEYDLIVLDLNLPGVQGTEVLEKVRKSNRPDVPVLILTARVAPAQRVEGLDAGADDYLTKPFDFDELCARLRALIRRSSGTAGSLLTCGDLSLDPATHAAWHGKRRLRLTHREFTVLQYLIYRSGEVVSQESLLEHVWGDSADPFTNVVRVHINSLRRKLGDQASAPRYIETVRGSGYRLMKSAETYADTN